MVYTISTGGSSEACSDICPSCGAGEMSIFYELRRIPVHSVLLLPTRDEAVNYPKGDILLGFCQACGFVSNVVFDPALHEYSAKYEATQGYSTTFNKFHERLAQSLVERYQLYGRCIIEIGCGQGEFLGLLCEMGGNQGMGFDPAFVSERSQVTAPDGLSFVQDFFSEKYSHESCDFLCCKMTLEHIHKTGDFLRMIHRSLVQDQERTLVFFQVPNARYVFGDVAFWDVYYEHCSYFSHGSLARLFRSIGFEVLDLWTDYDDQYLMITARVSNTNTHVIFPEEDDLNELARDVFQFQKNCPQKISAWRQYIQDLNNWGKRMVLWGGGSKAVAFLTTIGIPYQQLPYVVDINPHKAGTYLTGTGQEILSPNQLCEYQPEVVIVMNPVYCIEIESQLQRMGLAPTMLSVLSI
jgi:SAM-dependent methyltransferase